MHINNIRLIICLFCFTSFSHAAENRLFHPSLKDTFEFAGETYKVKNRLSDTESSQVYRARSLSSGRFIVLKALKLLQPLSESESKKEGELEEIDSENLSLCIKELEPNFALATKDHPNIVKFLGYQNDAALKNMFLFYEYADSTLFKHIYGKVLGYELSFQFIKELSLALKFVHDHGYIHGDIKPENVLLTRNLGVKLSDFGLSHCQEGPFQSHARICTLWYRAPELILGDQAIKHHESTGCASPWYDEKIDIWSLGLVFYEIFAHQALFKGHTEGELITEIFSICGTPNEETWPGVSELKYFDPDFSVFESCLSEVLEEEIIRAWSEKMPDSPHELESIRAFSDLIRLMLSLDPKKRPNMDEIVSFF